MKRLTFSFVMILIAFIPLGALAKTINVVASFSILADIIRQVGGEHVKVTELIGSDGNPHFFEPTPKDSQSLLRADIIFINGLELESWINRLIIASGYQGNIVTASTGINPRTVKEGNKLVTDPHAWNSANNGALYAFNVMNALIKISPRDTNYFLQHGKIYIQKLKQLDAWAKKEFSSIRQEKRKVLISYDAFGYLASEYGVQFFSLVGLTSENEVSASYVARLIDQIKQNHVSSYFIENWTDSRLVKQIARAGGIKCGGRLYLEALSSSNGPAATYEAAFRYNIAVLANSMK